MNTELTQSQEDYLETILDFAQEYGHAHVRDIAERLGVRMASVSGALKTLRDSGLVNYQRYGTVTLSAEGENLASKVRDRHKLLERFMEMILGVDRETAQENACRMEHTVDEKVLRRLARYVEFVEGCPVQACTWQAQNREFCGSSYPCESSSESQQKDRSADQ